MSHVVLLVEDEADLRETLRDGLEMYGYTVVAAEDGQHALEELERIDKVCLILLDLLMPRMNGWDFYAKLRERPERAAVPVIVHSSATQAAPAGVTRVLAKPVSFERLIATIREFCGAA
jgi:CheY-like chemotaxis protein